MSVRLVGVAVALLVACGGSDPEPDVEDSTSHTGGESRPHSDGLQVTGLMGTLSQLEISRGLDPKMPRFMACFTDRYEQLEMLGGEMVFAFRVAVDGSVLWVHPRASTVGDRETERCLLRVASGARFPRPHGGEAEFSWPLAFDPPEDVRPPLNWDLEQLSEAVADNREAAQDQCGSLATFQVTVYIAPGGSVMASGASTTDPDATGSLDCVAEAVRGWSMPDPGSYPAKATFELR